MGAVGDDLDALRDQAVDDLHHRLLVAGNGARGEDHAVAARRRSPPDARPRRCGRAPRAARPGCRCRAPPPCRAADSRRCRASGIRGCRRDSRSRARPATMRSMARPTTTTSRSQAAAASATARMRATLEAKVVTADAPRAPPDQLGQRLGDLGFRRRAALADGIGGIADQREAALVAERAQLRLVGRRADHRRRVDLPVAGVQHGAERRADDETVRFRDRMRDRHELDVERAEREAAAERHDVDRDLRRARLALPLGLEQRGGERRGIDRNLAAAARDRAARRNDPRARG